MEKKKLLMVTPYFYPKIGGLENYAFNISKGLKEKYNWEIVVITSNHENTGYQEETINGIKIYRLPRWFKVSNTPINPMWYWQIKDIIKKENPNVINAHSPVPFIADMAAKAAKSLGIPFVLTYHNDLVKENPILNTIIKIFYFLLGNKTIRISTQIIATSQFYADSSTYLKEYKNKISIVSPGTYLPKEAKVKQLKNTILFVSQLDKTHRHKGLNYLIGAIAEVKKEIKDLQLIICGKGNDLDYYRELVNKFNLQDNITFKGFVKDFELRNLYFACTALILPSTTNAEGFGMVLVDAMAHKRPVIGTNVGGIPHLIENNKNGLLVSKKNTEELSKAIIKVLKDKTIAKKMGIFGYNKVKGSFTWDIQVKNTNKILLSLI